MSLDVMNARVAAVRRFNRFYTRQLGVLDEIILQSPYSLTEARVLYELAQHTSCAAKNMATRLGIDAGYLSRTIQALTDKGLMSRRALPNDRRQYALALTAKGRLAFGKLDKTSHDEIAAMLERLGSRQAEKTLRAMALIETSLTVTGGPVAATVRALHPGDIGWVIQSHGALYAAEYGFDSSFEALVAQIAGDFLKAHDPALERCWIAERDGEPVGSVFLVRETRSIAKLRLLLVTPSGRGQRLGQRLVSEAIGFARQCGYRKITLWTQSNLLAARRIYQDANFTLVASEPHDSFGQKLTGETWELKL